MRRDIFVEGLLPDGRHLVVLHDPYLSRDAVVTIDDVPVEITGRVDRLRDGGTTRIPTAEGMLVVPNRLGVKGPQVPTLNGAPIT